MPYTVQINNYYNNSSGHGNHQTERAPLTVAGTTYTDGTFSTITLDPTLVTRNIEDSNGSADVTVIRPPRCQLLFFIAFALVEGSIPYHYEIWWAVYMNILIVTTGMTTLLAGTTSKTIPLVTLWVWGLSAAIGVMFFGGFVVWRGHEKLLVWCLAYANERYADYDLNMGVCATLETDGTLERIWIGGVVLGLLFGFPFLHSAIRTVYRFYANAKATASGRPQRH